MAVAAKRKMTRAKVTKKPTRARTPKFVDEKYTGPEPDWTYAEDMTAEEYYRERCRTGFYYNYFYTTKDGKPWVLAWMKDNGYTKEQIAAVKAVPDSWVSIAVAGYCRALSKGMPVNHNGLPEYLETLPGVGSKAMTDADAYVKEKLAEAIERGKSIKQEKEVEEKKKDIPRPSIQQLLREKAVEMASEIDEFVDKFDYKTATLKSFDPLTLLRKAEAKGNHAKTIKSFYQLEWEEYDELLNPPKRMTAEKKDDYEQLKEGYAHLKKAEIKAAYQMYQNILDACDMLVQEGKVNRAPRKKKPMSKDKIVAKVKYCKQDTATKSVSIKPIDVLDASAVMVYNVKTRKLGIYYPDTHSSLSFKGTTLTGFDESKSVQKTMRKPAEQVSKFKKVTKRSLQKQFDEVKSVETKMNGRFNEQTLILKVF
jgi:hypothetical protein